MLEVVAAFSAAQGEREGSDPPIQTTNRLLRLRSEECLEFAKRHLDRIEIRRVLRQVTQRGAGSFDRLLHASNFMSRKIVHHHDIVTPERRGQTLLDIGQECRSVDWPVKDQRRHHPIVTQRSHQGDCLPMPVRNVADQSLATLPASPETDQVRAGGGLIDEHQPRRIKIALLANPAPSRAGHVGALLLCGPQAFF